MQFFLKKHENVRFSKETFDKVLEVVHAYILKLNKQIVYL